MIPCFMPLAIGKTVDKRVIKGLYNQTIPLSLIVCLTRGVINSQNNYSAERLQGEISSRSLGVENSKGFTNCEYILSIDRDIVLTSPSAVSQMVSALDEDSELGVVSLWFERGSKVTLYLPHISIQCCLFRREVFSRLDFSLMKGFSCTCGTVKDQVEKQGYKMGYLDFNNYSYELR